MQPNGFVWKPAAGKQSAVSVRQPGLVSIVLPTYKGARRIRDAIESVRAQTYSPWELIVVIDGSTDNTAGIVQQFNDERIALVHFETNRGPSESRNAAIAVASGEFVAFIDDDDQWLPDKLARQVALLRDNPDLGLVHGGVLDVMEDGRRLTRLPPRDARSYRANLLQDRLALSTVLVRRSVLDRVGLFDPSLNAFEDWDLWTRVLRLYESDFIADVVVIARQRGGSLMHGNVARLSRDRARVVQRNWRTLRARGLGRRALAFHHYFVGGLLLVDGQLPQARRRAERSLRLRPSARAALLYAMSFAGGSLVRPAWRQLQRLRRAARA
jgi:glycosyltransferase involved in cell wall biosynthesis